MSKSAENLSVDVLVLGAGPGGYVAAIRAAQLGKSVAIVEREYWGGVCLNVGCIPTKVLLRHAEVAQLTSKHAAQFGLPEGITADFSAAHLRSRAVADGRVKGVHYLMKKNGISELQGTGRFIDDNTMIVTTEAGSESKVSFTHAIIATGSEIRTLPGVDLGAKITGYIELVTAQEIPATLTIIGAGPIGVELACVAASFGSQVTLVEYQDRIIPLEDEEVSADLAKSLKKMGITVITGAQVEGATENTTQVEVRYVKDGETSTLISDHVMVSVGFAPRVTGFGLENTSVELGQRGEIAVDGQLRTSAAHIFAIGDVTAKLALAHVAEAQGVLAAEVIAEITNREMGDYRMMPRAVYSLPQAASFGLTESQAREELGDIIVAKFPFVANGKAHAVGETQGFIKLIAHSKTRALVGGHMVGPDVSELLPELTLAAQQQTIIEDLVLNVHAHPTLSESLQEAFHGLAGHMINF